MQLNMHTHAFEDANSVAIATVAEASPPRTNHFRQSSSQPLIKCMPFLTDLTLALHH